MLYPIADGVREPSRTGHQRNDPVSDWGTRAGRSNVEPRCIRDVRVTLGVIAVSVGWRERPTSSPRKPLPLPSSQQTRALVSPRGLEPLAYGLGNRRSIHLSYGDTPGRLPAPPGSTKRPRNPRPARAPQTNHSTLAAPPESRKEPQTWSRFTTSPARASPHRKRAPARSSHGTNP